METEKSHLALQHWEGHRAWDGGSRYGASVARSQGKKTKEGGSSHEPSSLSYNSHLKKAQAGGRGQGSLKFWGDQPFPLRKEAKAKMP